LRGLRKALAELGTSCKFLCRFLVSWGQYLDGVLVRTQLKHPPVVHFAQELVEIKRKSLLRSMAAALPRMAV
jgi:hypothetical protein